MHFFESAKTKYKAFRDGLFKRTPQEQVDTEARNAELGQIVLRGHYLAQMQETMGWKEFESTLIAEYTEANKSLRECDPEYLLSVRARLEEIEKVLKIVPEAIKKAQEANAELEAKRESDSSE